MNRKTARKYVDGGVVPSAIAARPRDWRTRLDPFEEHWPEIEECLRQTPEFEAKTLFELPQDRHPDRRPFNTEYLALMRHFGMTPRTTAIGAMEQNGDVEASNDAVKRRLDRRLFVFQQAGVATWKLTTRNTGASIHIRGGL